MVINLKIQTGIIDIRNDTPRKSDIFLVDINVWFWQTYTNASTTAQPYQLKNYPNYLLQALGNESTLSYSVLTLAELASLIERTELKKSALAQELVRASNYLLLAGFELTGWLTLEEMWAYWNKSRYQGHYGISFQKKDQFVTWLIAQFIQVRYFGKREGRPNQLEFQNPKDFS